MSIRIPGLSPLPPATPRRQEEPRARADRPEAREAAGNRAPAAEPVQDTWVPRELPPGPAPPAPAAPPEAVSTAGQWSGMEPAPPTEAAAGAAAEIVRQALQARPPQAYGVHGNLVASTVLNLLA